MNSLDILLKYILTEKSTEMGSHDKYTFVVAPTATRAQVRQAVEQHFGDVKISKINILNRKGKIKSSRTRGLSASGGTEHLKIFKVSNINTSLKFLKTKEFWVSAFDVSAAKDFTSNNWKGKNVLLFGSEGFGLKSKTLMHSDFKFKVKMNDNMESLNISNTVSVVCHHIYQSIK